jgi:mRNA interferase MazF
MKPYQRGDVVLINIPVPENSHVQGGNRPWLIVQNNVGNQFSPTSIVVPLTTKFKKLEMPTHVPVTWENIEPSMVECEQVRVVDVTENWKYICTLPPQIMSHVDEALKNAFFYGGGELRNGK